MGFTVTANTPTLGHIAWTNAHIVYEGINYPIASGSTPRKFVCWIKSNPGVFLATDTYPALGADDCIVFLNKGGVPISVLTATATEGDLVVPGTITSTSIATDTIDASHIKSDAIVARHILAGSVTAEKLAVNQLSAISANLGTMTAGNFTLDANGFIKGGASTYHSGEGFWMGRHDGKYKFRAGRPGGSAFEWNGDGFQVYGPDGGVTISSGVVNYANLLGRPTLLAHINPVESDKLGGIESGATRNAFRGNWGLGVVYAVGDMVIDEIGYGWICVEGNTSSVTLRPPSFPVESNRHWKVYLIKGNTGDSYLLNLSDTSIVRNPAGVYSRPTVTATAQMLANVGLYAPYAGRFLIRTSVDGTFFTDAYSSSLDESAVTFTLPPRIKEARFFIFLAGTVDFFNNAPLDVASLPILDDATSFSVFLQSSNGTIFRPGHAAQTTIAARVFRNGFEITEQIPASAFKWTRNSIIPQSPPNDDSTWNSRHASGFKGILVNVDEVFSRATFHCEVSF